MTPRRYNSFHTLYGIGTAFVFLFMLAPLLVVLGRQAEKERLGSIKFYPDWIFVPLQELRRESTFSYIFSEQPFYSATVLMLRCDEKGTVHWYERDSLRFIFPREHHDRFRMYFQKLARNILADSTRLLLAEVQFHPAALHSDVITILDAGAGVNYHFVISSYGASRFGSDERVYLAEHRKYTEPQWGLLRCCLHSHSPQPVPTGLAATYSSVMQYFGFTPDMYQHNLRWFE